MDKRPISKSIRRIRKDNNLNQSQFGEKIGYSQRTVSDWENGNTEPNLEAIKKIMSAFDVTYEDLLG